MSFPFTEMSINRIMTWIYSQNISPNWAMEAANHTGGSEMRTGCQEFKLSFEDAIAEYDKIVMDFRQVKKHYSGIKMCV
jgi:hypothetical protein